jgi:hypothetical protein
LPDCIETLALPEDAPPVDPLAEPADGDPLAVLPLAAPLLPPAG